MKWSIGYVWITVAGSVALHSPQVSPSTSSLAPSSPPTSRSILSVISLPIDFHLNSTYVIMERNASTSSNPSQINQVSISKEHIENSTLLVSNVSANQRVNSSDTIQLAIYPIQKAGKGSSLVAKPEVRTSWVSHIPQHRSAALTSFDNRFVYNGPLPVISPSAPTGYQLDSGMSQPTSAPTPLVGGGILWGNFQEALLKRGTRFENLGSDTDWPALLAQLGFDPLSAGRLLFVIQSQPRISKPAYLRAHAAIEQKISKQEIEDAIDYQYPVKPIRPVLLTRVGSDPEGWWWGGNDRDYFNGNLNDQASTATRFRSSQRNKQRLRRSQQQWRLNPAINSPRQDSHDIHQAAVVPYSAAAKSEDLHRPPSLPGMGDVQWQSHQPSVPFADPVPVPQVPGQEEDSYDSYAPPSTSYINDVAALKPLHKYPDPVLCCSGSTTWCCGTTSKWNAKRIFPQPDLNTYSASPIVTVEGWKDTLLAQEAAPIITALSNSDHLNLKQDALNAAQKVITAAAAITHPVVRNPTLDDDDSTADQAEQSDGQGDDVPEID